MSTPIPQDAEVWTAVFYLNLPTDEDLPTSLEDWPGAKYIIYKSYQSSKPGYGENLMGYVQFTRKLTGTQLRTFHPNMVWKYQASSNYKTINYIRTRFEESTVRPVVELGEHWPFRSAPATAPVSTI